MFRLKNPNRIFFNLRLQFLLLFFFLGAAHYYSVAQHPIFIKYTEQDGLLGNGVSNHLFQDSKGFIWISAPSGFSRYDGTNFKHFKVKENPNFAFIRAVEDPNNKLWVLSYYGELAYLENEKLILFPVSNETKSLLAAGRTWDFQVDSSENIYIGTRRKGLWKIDTLGNAHPIISPNEGHEGLGLWWSDYLPPIPFGIESINNQVLADTISIYDQEFECSQIIPIPLKHQTLEFRSVFYKINEDLMALTYGDFIFKVSKKKGLLESCRIADFIFSICVDRHGDWLVGTRFGGLKVFPQGKLNPSKSYSFFPDERINWITNDKDGALWLSVKKAGIWQIPSKKIQIFNKSNTNLPSHNMSRINVSDSTLYISTSEKKVYTFKNQQFDEIKTFEMYGGSHLGTLGNMFYDSTNQRTYFSYDERIGYLKDGKFTEIFLPQEKIGKLSLTNFFKTKDGDLWAFGIKGAAQIENDTLADVIFLKNAWLAHSAKLRNGRLFLSGINGLYEFKDNTIKSLDTLHYGLGSRVGPICELKNQLWFFSFGYGLTSFDGDSLTFWKDHYSFDKIRRLQTEGDTLWAVNSEHLLKLIPQKDTLLVEKYWINFSRDVLYNDFTIANNTFYFISSSGLITLPKSELVHLRSEPIVQITNIKINEQDTTVQEKYTLNYTQDMIQIEFGGIHFRSPDRVYRYRMSGIDKTWKYTSQQSIQYTKLTPGEYEFQVYMSSSEKIESPHPARFILIITPPFWETLWFRFTTLSLIIILLYIGIRFRIKQVLRQKEIDKQLYELESKALRSQMNPHFIFNVLGAIQSYVSERDVVASEIYLSKFARLIRLILENSRKSYVTLDSELEMIQHYLEMEKMRFRNEFDYDIQIAENVNNEMPEIPPMLIQPYLENAIIHGFSTKESNRKIKLEFTLEEEMLYCTVSDNGSGMDSESVVQKSIQQQSLGMLITKERLQLLNADKDKYPEIRIESITEGDKTGTTVFIKIPTK